MTVEHLIDELLTREGGFVDHPADRGGATKYGITADTLGGWRQLRRAATRAEVQALGEDEARAIYQARYLEQPGFLAIEDPALRALVVDIGVHSGPATAVTLLQQAVGFTGRAVDGVLGRQTRAAIAAQEPRVVIAALIRARGELVLSIALDRPDVRAFLRAHPTSQLHFLRGWMRRTLAFVT